MSCFEIQIPHKIDKIYQKTKMTTEDLIISFTGMLDPILQSL